MTVACRPWKLPSSSCRTASPVRTLLKTAVARGNSKVLKGLNLLTSHPVLYVCNVSEADAATGQCPHRGGGEEWQPNRAPKASSYRRQSNPKWRSCPDEESQEFLAALGLEEAGLDR